MPLTDLGFDDDLRRKLEDLARPDLLPARITRVDRDRYLVRNETGEVQAEPTGRLLYSAASPQDLPCVGDWALVQYHNEGSLAIIHDLLPRTTFLRRKAAGAKVEVQMIAANIDTAFVVQSCDGDFNPRRLDRYLVMVREGRIEPVILLSKTDLADPQTVRRMLGELTSTGATAMGVSNTTGEGLEPLRKSLRKGKTYCLLGSSGVGKTTLLNRLLGREEFETQGVRETDGRGRHTTSRRQLTILENGALLIDTPGMRELGMIDAETGIEESFPEFHELSGQCRFTDCTHTVERDCAIREAVERGELDEERYRSFLKLMKESAFYGRSYAERREKDKQFGRMIHVAMKQLRKRKPSV